MSVESVKSVKEVLSCPSGVVLSKPPIARVCEEVTTTIIFRFLTGKELAKVSSVQKEWKQWTDKPEFVREKAKARAPVTSVTSIVAARSWFDWSNRGEEFY